jgi:soluble lytic murein transglycosylase-like protein
MVRKVSAVRALKSFIRTCYMRNGHLRTVVERLTPMKRSMIITMLLTASVAHAGERKFSAADVPTAGLRKGGRIVIENDRHAITATRFFGNIREALFSLRLTQSLAFHPFGAEVFNSAANLNAPVPAYLSAMFSDAAREHGVDPRLLAAIARRESAWNPAAVSKVGASGVMQLMPATAKFLGVTNVFDPRENIFGGARYLRTLLATFHGDLDLTLAAYNAGPGAVQRYNGVPPFAETREYVRLVRSNYEKSLTK